jgi:DNA/RNA-binding domain of Phe-tRNA-synthetase-like protein
VRTPIRLDDVEPRLIAGVVEALGVRMAPAPDGLRDGLDVLLRHRAEQASFPPPELKDGIRALLRSGGYKPSGRGKPASEYLAAAARKGSFPRISNAVDAANRYSLLTGLPISLLDLDAALEGTTGLVIRHGAPHERYVFNASGQEIDVAGLLCVAREDGGAVGNAVKDSLATRTSEDTRNLLGVIWCSVDVAPVDVVERMAAQLGAQLAEHAGATTVSSAALHP